MVIDAARNAAKQKIIVVWFILFIKDRQDESGKAYKKNKVKRVPRTEIEKKA